MKVLEWKSLEIRLELLVTFEKVVNLVVHPHRALLLFELVVN
jgi:hypothetical protein